MSKRNYEVGPLREPLDDYISLAGEALLSNERYAWDMYVERIGRDNMRGVYRNQTLAGGLAFYRMGQYFGGKPLDCAGVSGVAISPAERGSGTCSALLTSLLQELREEEMPIASLYASTQYLYRKFGFEHAGTQTLYSIPLSSLNATGRELPVHRLTEPCWDRLNQVAEVRAQRGNGQLRRTEGLWKRLTDPYDQRGSILYLIGDSDAPEGFAIFRPGTRDGGVPQPLVSTDVVANTPAACRRLLTLVHDHRSMTDSFEWYGGPNDLFHYFAEEQWLTVKQFLRWMLRIVHVPLALANRGYASHLSGQLHLQIEDPLLPENNGPWLLSLDHGKATVEPGGRGEITLRIEALAPLYSSFYSATELMHAGQLRADSEFSLAFADQAFAGPSPWVAELY